MVINVREKTIMVKNEKIQWLQDLKILSDFNPYLEKYIFFVKRYKKIWMTMVIHC